MRDLNVALLNLTAPGCGMIVDVSTQPAGTTRRAPSDDDRAGVARVRRRDIRALRTAGYDTHSSFAHGDEGDPRYPSPRVLRETIGFAIDLVVHLGGAAVVFLVTLHLPLLMKIAGYAPLLGVLAFFALSIGDRVLFQRMTGTTVGKGLVGLRVIRRDNGQRPTMRQLLHEWFWGTFAVIASLAG